MHVYSCSNSNTQDYRHAYFFGIQGIQAGVTWKQCADLPVGLSVRESAVSNGKVYCGGGSSTNDTDLYSVYCYDPSLDNWTTLPPLPVKWFGLGQVNGQLVAVGGEKKIDGSASEVVYTYD